MHLFKPSILALTLYTILFHPFISRQVQQIHPFVKIIWVPQLFFLLSTIFILKLTSTKRKAIGFMFPNNLKPILISSAMAFVPLFFMITFEVLSRRTTNVPCPLHPSLITLFILFILAPISEELFFRGVLLHALKERYTPTMAIILSSIIFMLSHGLWAAGPLCLGILAGYMVIKWGTLWPGILFHAISNSYLLISCYQCPNAYHFIQKLPLWFF